MFEYLTQITICVGSLYNSTLSENIFEGDMWILYFLVFFLTSGFLAVAFLVEVFLAVGFVKVDFVAADFLAEGFLASESSPTRFFLVGFLAFVVVGSLEAGLFIDLVFLATCFLLVGLLFIPFLFECMAEICNLKL